jgi:hypothetical protein
VPLLLLVGCAAEVGPPSLDEDDVPPLLEPDVDVRTIDETGDEPLEAPVTPSGATIDDGLSEAEESEGYRTIGGILGEVNGVAIYADDVIDARRNELRGLALSTNDPTRFRNAAAEVIVSELRRREQERLQLAVYERHTGPTDRQNAENLVLLWRERFISDHGGSEVAARQAAREQYGMSLERLGEDEYRRRLGDIFLRRHVLPRVRPGAAELREAYDAAQASGEITTPAGIDFQLIVFEPDEAGLATARERAARVRQLAVDGESFEELARAHGDDPDYAERGGRLPASLVPLQPGSFRVRAVDDAVWQTAQGELTPVVEADGKLYLAKVVAKQEATTPAFEDIQRNIANALMFDEQQRLMMDYVRKEATRIETPDTGDRVAMLRAAMEVVMQQYAIWREEGASATR